MLFFLALKKTTHRFPLTFQIKERLGNEDLIQRIQDMEQSTARVVRRLEEENAILKENIQMLEEATAVSFVPAISILTSCM